MTRTPKHLTVIECEPIPGYPAAAAPAEQEPTEADILAMIVCDEYWRVRTYYRRECDRERACKIMGPLAGLGFALIMASWVVAWAGHPWWAGLAAWAGVSFLIVAAGSALTVTHPQEGH